MMTPTQYAEQLTKDNVPTMEHYIESNLFLSEYLALWGAVAISMINVERPNQSGKERAFQKQTLKILQKRFINFCLINEDKLKALK